MKLLRARVQNFRCIVDSGDVEVDEGITILVSKNEFGKTAFLEALGQFKGRTVLNAADLSDNSPERDKYKRGRIGASDIPITTLTFTLEPHEVENLLGSLKADNTITVQKYMDGHYSISLGDITLDEHLGALRDRLENINNELKNKAKAFQDAFYRDKERGVVKRTGAQDFGYIQSLDGQNDYFFRTQWALGPEPIWTGEQIEFSVRPARYRALTWETYPEAFNIVKNTYVDEAVSSFLNANLEDLGAFQTACDNLISRLKTVPSYHPKLVEAEEFATYLRSVQEFRSNVDEQEDLLEGALTTLLDAVPNLAYIPDFGVWEDEIAIEELINTSGQHPAIENLLKIGEVSPAELKTASNRVDLLAEAEKNINEAIADKWKRQALKTAFRLDWDEGKLCIRVADTLSLPKPPTRRSRGMQYFTSMVLSLLQHPKGGSPWSTILLLDDPGVHLHGESQVDMMAFLKELAEHTQIIMATHSPFCIGSTALDGIKIVERSQNGTTAIRSFRLGVREEAIEPIRGALGLDLAKSLFPSRSVILTEGPSDATYLQGFLDYLEDKEGKVYIDTNKVSLFPCHDAGSMAKLGVVFLVNGFNFVLLYDADKAFQDRPEFTKQKELRDHVVSYHDIPGVVIQGHECAIEDLLDEDTYATIVCELFGKSSEDVKSPIDHEPSKKRTERYLSWLGKQGLKMPSKNKVARRLVEKLLAGSLTPAEETCERFRQLFQILNDKLSVGASS